MTNGNIKIVWFFLRPYKIQLLALLALSLTTGILEAVNIAAVYPILLTAFSIEADQGNLVFTFIRILSDLIPVANSFISYTLVFLLSALLAFAFRVFLIRRAAKFCARLVEENQREAYSKFIKADYQYFIDHKEGELIHNIATAPKSLSTLVTSVTELTSQTILSLSILALLVSLSW